MKILLVLILLLPTAFAINLTVDYPKNVLLNSEFEIGIYSNSSESFDIKIDIFEDEKRISRIWNGEKWASTMYYLINDFSSEKTYQLKTENHIGIADLIVKLRKDKDVFIFGPYQINIDKSNSENNEIEN
ncbi:MAG: hypothetical protein JXL97_03610, partial [Bacteroidales bacterium]|nr:hypothetical protein [Bacteroidales bacterium]